MKYELGLYIPEDGIFIVTAVETSNLKYHNKLIGIEL
jgi:hypothetical protein